MSAFLVSHDHIAALVRAGLPGPDRLPLSWRTPEQDVTTLTRGGVNRVGQMLWGENHRSVAYRYDQPATPPQFRFRDATPLRDATSVLKLLDCYEYQTCEHPTWPTSEAFAYCQSLRSRLITTLPGYDDAPWTI